MANRRFLIHVQKTRSNVRCTTYLNTLYTVVQINRGNRVSFLLLHTAKPTEYTDK